MTSFEDKSAPEPTNWRSLGFKAGSGAVAGAAGAAGMTALLDSGALGTFDTSREIAAMIGLLYVLTGGIVGFGLVSPAAGAKFLNVEDGEELIEMRPMLAWSVLGTMAIAGILFFAAFAAPAGPIAEPVVLAAITALFALAWFAGHRQSAHCDELMRAYSRDSMVTAFYLSAGIGGGWSLLAHLGYTAGPKPLDWLTMFAGFIMLSAFITSVRRGMIRRG